MKDIDELKNELDKLFKTEFLIFCLGNKLRADDGVGVIIGEALLEKLPNPKSVIIGGNAPANYIGKIAKMGVKTLLIIDAIDFGLAKGTITLSDEKIVVNTQSTTTHYQELSDLLKFLELEGVKPTCQILGIQIDNTSLLQSMSLEVHNASVKLIELIVSLLE